MSALVTGLEEHGYAVRIPDDQADSGFTEKAVKVGVVSETEAEILEGLVENEVVLEVDFADLDLDSEPNDGGGGGEKKPRKDRGGSGGKRGISGRGRS